MNKIFNYYTFENNQECIGQLTVINQNDNQIIIVPLNDYQSVLAIK